MKGLFSIILLLAIGLLCRAQEREFVVEGCIRGESDSVVVELTHWFGSVGKRVATAKVEDGKFRMNGKVRETPARMMISVRGNTRYFGNRTLWVGEHATKIRGESYSLADWRIRSGIKEQVEEERFHRKSKAWRGEAEAVSEERGKLFGLGKDVDRDAVKHLQDSLYQIVDSLFGLVTKADLELVKQRPLTVVSLEKLYDAAHSLMFAGGERVDRKEIERQYLRLDSAQRLTLRGEEIYTILYPPKVVSVGDQMADGLLRDVEGRPHRLSDYKGKYILLDFWSAGCGPCVMAGPEMKEVAEEHCDSLNVISISVDTSVEIWKEASEDINWVNLSDLKGGAGIVAHYKEEGLPHFVIIDREGTLVDEWWGYGKGVIRGKLAKYWREKQGGNKDK